MKKILVLAILAFAIPAQAEYNDVIQVEIKETCSVTKYVAIKNDFNTKWGSANGYTAQVLVPIQAQDLATVFWVGTTANAEAFGKAWDTWRTQVQTPGTEAAKLWDRFLQCSTNITRTGWDIY